MASKGTVQTDNTMGGKRKAPERRSSNLDKVRLHNDTKDELDTFIHKTQMLQTDVASAGSNMFMAAYHALMEGPTVVVTLEFEPGNQEFKVYIQDKKYRVMLEHTAVIQKLEDAAAIRRKELEKRLRITTGTQTM